MKIGKRRGNTLVPINLPVLEEPRVDKQWDLFEHGITQGFLSVFLDCPERARLTYHERLSTPRTGGALAFGSLVHEVLDRIYSAHQTREESSTLHPQRAQWLPQFLEEELKRQYTKDIRKLREFPSVSPTAVPDMQLNYGMAAVTLKHYFVKWKEDLTRWKWLALEKVFDVPYPVSGNRTVRIRGKRDGDFRISKDLMLFETKTKSRIEEDVILDPLWYNLQVNTYLMSMHHDYGEWARGVVYNVIRRPQLRQGKGETPAQFIGRVDEDISKRPDWYFIRYNVPITVQDQQRWRGEFDQMINRVVRWYDSGFKEGHFRNPGACSGRYGSCQYLPLCGRGQQHLYEPRPIIFPELEEVQEDEG